MAELIIRLEVDPQTRKKNVIISYRSDEDALPVEHEEDHRRLVNGLIEGGALQAAELGQIIVERVDAEGVPAQEEGQGGTQDQRESVKQES
jgi:FtsH ternary system domain X3-analog